jgi:hypothetical protein
MDFIFFILWVACTVMLILGMVNPKMALIPYAKRGRKQVFITWFISGVFCFVVFITLIMNQGQATEMPVENKPANDKLAKQVTTNELEDPTAKKLDNINDAEESSDQFQDEIDEKAEKHSTDELAEVAYDQDVFNGYTLIKVDGGDFSNNRKDKVVVNIGFGDREYYAFTNQYGQVIKVIAKEIVIQDDSKEPVKNNNRYYNSVADMVPEGVSDYDNGHIIADCLGGVANAYNITPQNSTLNRHGDQAYMEKIILSSNSCTDFVGIISYPDTITMIPDFYKFNFKINGEEVAPFEFANENPDYTQ